eukprot:CAMPEP_0201481010 /NCGR_PEP_ID=MMETSP0151_2-20130828/5349_1 /ASSEMBLY_ACC=CAM_ASM_000257 /TAXON_ID=200890 /ORGANISM="Paramoeba atlantica, Strain 621/1 / CCAP 1560/9" /LENGTH=269 /DNA_ID=CAMNT_0047863023 /DNA_START=99 /DNA_END=908 /DNA_ORIENTATION=+
MRPYYCNTVTKHSQWEFPLHPAYDVPPQPRFCKSQPPLPSKENFDDWTVVESDELLLETDKLCGDTQQDTQQQQQDTPQPISLMSSFSESLSGSFSPLEQQKSGQLEFFFMNDNDFHSKSVPMNRWCVLETGELFFLPMKSSPASLAEWKLPLVDVSEVVELTELQAGRPFGLSLNISESNVVCPFINQKRDRLIIFPNNEQEKQEWHAVLRRVARGLRAKETASQAPAFLASGMKSASRVAFSALGAGFGWSVGRNAGDAASRAAGFG